MSRMLFEIDAHGRIAALPTTTALPEGAYTTLRTYAGTRVLRFESHVARLSSSAAALPGAPARLAAERVREGLAAALASACLPEARVRLTFAPPRLFASLLPFEPLAEQCYAQGVACMTVPVRRQVPHAKDTRFLASADAARATLPADVHEGLMVDERDGALLEGLSSNFFALCAGVLRSEPERVLHGVTRAIVLELGATLAPVRLQAVRRGELGEVSEAFLTSVSRGVLPVVRIDGRPLGDGRPGTLTRALRAAFDELAQREARDLRAG